jgi:chemotaxis protein MotB
LLGLFIILYAISNIDNNKYKNVVAAFDDFFGKKKVISALPDKKIIPDAKEKLSYELSKLIKEYNYTNSVQLEENDRGITIHILEDILFAPGNSELTETSRLVLKRLATVIRNIPNDIRVEGYTDNTPINTLKYPSNWHLSSARALNTAYYLIKEEGILPDKVSVVGNGENKPLSSNDFPETRAKNRRVDIVILK